MLGCNYFNKFLNILKRNVSCYFLRRARYAEVVVSLLVRYIFNNITGLTIKILAKCFYARP